MERHYCEECRYYDAEESERIIDNGDGSETVDYVIEEHGQCYAKPPKSSIDLDGNRRRPTVNNCDPACVYFKLNKEDD
jgi:hypothetical protein